ncbi:SDR family NAD(P)-dependent oxidoreductase [Rhabdochromatium marinum]|uniref:SDR family NAD(P)-dependent oxidoreductase n=1 Tax=Rhabdochromatium marinum TaxID=48729 RepID=UPI001908D0A8|nr:SDR family NAD(P)-dependent oxidoreductase [Rhabdochromatium marinum]MBK1649484.1 YciK family oxidoreductase [Rhabdochromatium marinum]
MNQATPSDPQPSNQLTDRVILVTGAAEGLGRAVALACAHQGATLVLLDYEDTDLDSLYDEIEASGAPQPANFPLDMEHGDEDLFIGAADTLGQEFGRLDGLAHCAAFAPYLTRIDDYECKDWDRVLRVNLTAPFLLTQACLPLLRAAPDPSVVFTADRVGRQGLAYWGAYAAAKAGLEGLMQTLAAENQTDHPIRVNSLDPGILNTTMRRALYPGENPAHNASPESVTSSFIYLLGPASRHLSGQQLCAPCGP